MGTTFIYFPIKIPFTIYQSLKSLAFDYCDITSDLAYLIALKTVLFLKKSRNCCGVHKCCNMRNRRSSLGIRMAIRPPGTIIVTNKGFLFWHMTSNFRENG